MPNISGASQTKPPTPEDVLKAENCLYKGSPIKSLMNRRKNILQALCEQRDLIQTGTKDDLAKRLVEWVSPV